MEKKSAKKTSIKLFQYLLAVITLIIGVTCDKINIELEELIDIVTLEKLITVKQNSMKIIVNFFFEFWV